MRTWILCLAVAAASCGPKPEPAVVPAVTLVDVPHAGELQPGSTRITLTAARELRCNGETVTTSSLAARVYPGTGARYRETPVLVEADSNLKMADLLPLMETLMTNRCVNLEFLVRSGGVPKALVFPIELSHGCHALVYWEGARKISEHEGEKHTHLWVDVRTEPLRVDGISLQPEADVAPEPWQAEHLPFGAWTYDQVSALLARPEVAALSPIVRLHLYPDDPLAAGLKSLSELRARGAVVLPQVHPAR